MTEITTRHPDQTLTTQELMALLNLSRTTVWRRELDGSIPRAIFVGKRKLWRLTDIRRWLAAEAKKAARPLTA